MRRSPHLSEAIPLGARITAIVDAYDAMTTDHRQRSSSAALLELRRCAGTRFDLTMLHAFTYVLVESTPSHPEKLAA